MSMPRGQSSRSCPEQEVEEHGLTALLLTAQAVHLRVHAAVAPHFPNASTWLTSQLRLARATAASGGIPAS
eukprot:7985561-Heterocapsa_arctica.AAC.1